MQSQSLKQWLAYQEISSTENSRDVRTGQNLRPSKILLTAPDNRTKNKKKKKSPGTLIERIELFVREIRINLTQDDKTTLHYPEKLSRPVTTKLLEQPAT